MSDFNEEILRMNIKENIISIKKKALNNKQLLRNFLESLKIEGKSINDYITFKMLSEIENTEDPNYTYWMNTGLTWAIWYNGLFKKLSHEEYMSITSGYLKFHYIIINNLKNYV